MRGVFLFLALSLAVPATAADLIPCGGRFSDFLRNVERQARADGFDRNLVRRFLSNAALDSKVLAADQAQGIFRWDFLTFSGRVISDYRMRFGTQYARDFDPLFDRIERELGVSRGILLAFWALETDFGQVQGDFNTLNALLTLSHDCRRPELFQPQVFAALELYKRGEFDPATTTGAWAGEIGMVQMLPGDILENGIDGDGDGHVLLKSSIPDALMSGAGMLRSFGWKRGEPWLVEVTVPDNLDWSLSGEHQQLNVEDWERLGLRARSGTLPLKKAQASLLLPMGHKGPAFLGYHNFHTLFEWNQSFTYVMTAAYFASRLEGAPMVDPRNPDPGLGAEDMMALQRRLQQRGHDVGKIDGILGAGTRTAVRAEQGRLGLPVDGWPTPSLLRAL